MPEPPRPVQPVSQLGDISGYANICVATLPVASGGSLVPLSPPPGTFIDLEPQVAAGVSNVYAFINTAVAMVESVLRENQPIPPEALPFLHPFEANRLHHPTRPPPSSFRWTLVRMTWL